MYCKPDLSIVYRQVNPSHDNSSDAEANAKYLISTLNDVVNQIFMSAEHCPQ